MSKNLSFSIIKSVSLSAISSISSYILLIAVARLYSQESVSYYLYIVTIGILLTLVLDFAAEQALVHHCKTKSLDPYSIWLNLCKYKLYTVMILIFIASILNYYTIIKLPILSIFMIVPIFYMGPIFEYFSENILYARIILFEKLTLLFFVIILSQISLNINYIIYLYFIISIFSLYFQYIYTRPMLKITKKYSENFDIFNYINSYMAVYIILLSQLVYGNISRILIDAKIGPIAFAYITLSLQIINAISIVQSQVDRHIRPLVIQAINDKNFLDLQSVIRRYIIHYLVPIILCSILMSFLSTQIIQILYGPKWLESATALKFASPLVFTIACMRFIDILVVPLNATKMNLFINIASAIILFVLFWINPSQSLASYVILIVICQAVHVAFMSSYVYLRASRLMSRSV